MTSHHARFFLRDGELREWLDKRKRQKQVMRLRRKMAGLTYNGKSRDNCQHPPFITHEGVRHPLDCGCYDCTFGEIAELKRIAAQGRGSVETTEHLPARTGKIIKERK